MTKNQTPVAAAPTSENGGNGLPPVAIMQRMLDIQEKRLELDSRQIDINERELENNKTLGLRSMELNAAANSERTSAMIHVMKWRYGFWAGIGSLSAIAVVTALMLGKEAFVLEALKYLAVFIGGYGTKAAVNSRKKNSPSEESE